jgi:RimJ/RimL family protein N-acetyltransferase
MPVTLRDTTDGDAAYLELLHSREVEGPFDYFDDPPEQKTKAGDHGGGRKLIEVDGQPAGVVSFIQVQHGPNLRSRAWNIGIVVHPDFRGMGVGAEAQRLLAQHLLSTTEANRIEASTDVDNIAEQRALEKAGFRREGTMRGAQWRTGAWRDIVLYGLVRGD